MDERSAHSIKRPKLRPTIGYLTSQVYDGIGRVLWTGIVDAAQKQDVNLICFPGGHLRDARGFPGRRNALFDLVNTESLDGLVSWASAVGGTLDPDKIVDFHQRYHALPVVSLALALGRSPCVTVDGYRGMREAIVHLIEVHGYRRIAFICGPEYHPYSLERYHAYTDVLKEYGLPLNPNIVTPPGEFDQPAGAAAIRLLLDERKLLPQVDFEAVVTVSDHIALGALEALQARGIQVPGDVALVGFNDSMEGKSTTPPLTSVALPFYEQGELAVEVLLAQLEGERVPEQMSLPARLVVRQSCGCQSRAVAQAAARPIETGREKPKVAFSEWREEILSEITQRARSSEWAGQLLNAFSAELKGKSPGFFLTTLENILRRTLEAGGDVAVWQEALSVLRHYALPYLDHQALARSESLWGQARVMIGETEQRAQLSEQLQIRRQTDTMREIGQALITTFDIAKLMNMLAERLPTVGIPSCYFSLYENPKSSLEQSRLVLAYNEQGRVELEPGGRLFPSRQLVPEGWLPQKRRYSMIVELLYFHEEPIGFALFEIGPRDGSIYEVLRSQISSALKGTLLFREAMEARVAAEKADRIKTRLLANVSHELRTPLNIILGYTREALDPANPYGVVLPRTLSDHLEHIYHSAEHQLRLINDLLDLSRVEIGALDLYPELLDPRPLLEDAFRSMADRVSSQSDVTWRLELPDRLPMVQADPVRLRQILLNLLSNAHKFTEKGQISLGAQVTPPHLHIWVQDTGLGIPLDQQERIFEPFSTAEYTSRRLEGIGLGLSITRRLVALHCGSMALDSQPGKGSTFHIYLPLPNLSDQPVVPSESVQSVLLLIAAADQPAAEIAEFSQRQGLEIRRLHASDDVEVVLAGIQPAALAWDLASASPGDWALVRRLINHPRLYQSPFILYGQEQGNRATLSLGMTSFVIKPLDKKALLEAINAACPTEIVGPILIVDDDPQVCELYQDVLAKGLPDYPVRTANDGASALSIMAQETPSLVILDLMMPEVDGFDVLDQMRADPKTRRVPVLIMSSKVLTLDDVKRLEQHALVTFQSKGILSEAEIITSLHRALFGTDTLPQHTGALVKRAVAFLNQQYDRPLSRWEVAEAIGVSEDYLSRMFNRELGLSPWEYLNRYRIGRAKELLRHTNDNIRTVARQVGFKDQAYFSRVFRKLTGVPPNVFREQHES